MLEDIFYIALAIFCFIKGYILIGILALVGIFGRGLGFFSMLFITIFLYYNGHFIFASIAAVYVLIFIILFFIV